MLEIKENLVTEAENQCEKFHMQPFMQGFLMREKKQRKKYDRNADGFAS